ncbi:MAG: histidine--tRNA ligase [Actinobacteria bacterium]|uniref:histidine--tRNA ligase n=1 Tax=freshwater metagenome TaxID=449393 RepID=A0A6J7AG30_9ZZZZ|nr:histidine--tRNA ligase [Actinomycetota bacterium]
MAKPTRLSGFPELLPSGRVIEQYVLDVARQVFELHGFLSLETRAVEPIENLQSGEIAKEIYVLRRMHAADGEADPGLGLHFDLTVPFARYVLENSAQLEFPLRRYQIQKVWRGERPQDGRFREFTQADIDVVGSGALAFHHEIEMAVVMSTLLAKLPIPPAIIQVNNRKLAEGFYLGVGATDTQGVLRAIDKLDKIGADRVRVLLETEAGLTPEAAVKCIQLASIKTPDASFVDQVRALGVQNDLLDEGLSELAAVVTGANSERPGSVVADLRIARGLDYYTGTVYETQLVGFESVGSISSGGRYDNLASDGKQSYPGVGISLGVSRLVSVLIGRDLVSVSRTVPSAVLVAVTDEASRPASELVARQLRNRGISCEVAPSADKFGKQIRFADRRGIPFVWFPGAAQGESLEDDTVKDIRTGDQVPADATKWAPPIDDLTPRVFSTIDTTAVSEESS